MTFKILGIAAWTAWSVLLVLLVFMGFRIATERSHSPEAGRGLGIFAVGALLVVLVGLGVFLHFAIRRESTSKVVTALVIMAWPLVAIVADPLIRRMKAARFEAELARAGDFSSPECKALAESIGRDDAGKVRALLAGHPPPAGLDRAGNNLLAYAVHILTERKDTGLDTLRTLLEAGAGPSETRMGDGSSLLRTLMLSAYRCPHATDAVLLLLKHGADPNERDSSTGNPILFSAGDNPAIVRALVEHGADIDAPGEYGFPAVVNFISQRQWESAQFLVERGARLDMASKEGVSVDYYLKDWAMSVHGDNPAGWDRVREAIAKRRNAPSATTQ